jgi:DNA-nicking Smr family endonuclease
MKTILQLNQDLHATNHMDRGTKTTKKAKDPDKICLSMEEEDTIFLNAMGTTRNIASQKTQSAIIKNKDPLKTKRPKSVMIASLKELKKVKTINTQTELSTSSSTLNVANVNNKTAQTIIRQSETNKTPTLNANKLSTPEQNQIYLAAGISVAVSSSLNLNGHTKSDADERLRECVINGYILGWHNVHIVTGCSEELETIITDLLKSSTGKYITRYARAPMPMGGPNAWILYF